MNKQRLLEINHKLKMIMRNGGGPVGDSRRRNPYEDVRGGSGDGLGGGDSQMDFDD